jgi:dihydrofolate synthase/folylpolyglutamate synthase
MGGRLDATNVLTPMVSVVTNVALDHTAELGDSLSKVAVEKAGIFKPGVPAITGEPPGSALEVLRERAEVTECELRVLDEVASATDIRIDLSGTRFALNSTSWGRKDLHVGLIGAHQARNAVLAAETLALLPGDVRPGWDAVERGLGSARWPGRLQVERVRDTTWIFDVAHNPAGVLALAGTLDALELPRPLVVVAAILADKRWEEMLPPLLDRCDAAILTHAPSAPSSRRWNPDLAADRIRGHSSRPPRIVPDLSDALSRASTLAPHGTVLVTGSVHTVGDALLDLGLPLY